MHMPHYSATLCMLHQMCWVSSLNPTYILKILGGQRVLQLALINNLSASGGLKQKS